MSVEIRILGEDDGAILDHVAEDVFDDPVVRDTARLFLADPRHHIAVALDGGQVVGFASGVHYVHPDKRAPELFVNEVGVAASHHRRGLGKAVLQALLEEGKKQGCVVAWVLTDRDNTAAMRLYASAGGSEPSDHVMFSFDLEEAPR